MDHNAQVKDLQIGDVWKPSRESRFTRQLTRLEKKGQLVALEYLASDLDRLDNDAEPSTDLFHCDHYIFVVSEKGTK